MVNTYDYIMNKYGLKRDKEYRLEVPNMDRGDLARLPPEAGLMRGAEIGVERGYYSEVLCKANPNIELYAIDPWTHKVYDEGISGVDYEQHKHDGYYEETVKRLAPYNAKVMRMTSMDALKLFPDESLDFVYIDGNHDFLHVVQDVDGWKRKIRPGGILAGHDYARYPSRKHNHVKKALDAYMSSYHMFPYFIVGRFEVREGEKRDRFRSWFWVKK